MAKHVIIDSIARSGTTLVSAILRSQEKTMVFCPGFNEALSCKNIGQWPHGVCRQDFLQNVEIDLDKFKNESFSQIVDFSQYYGLSKDEWRSIIFDASSPENIRENIEQAFPEIELFCYRWNQGLCYFNNWVDKGQDYLWLSMIRNPLDRAISSFEKHGWTYEDSLKNTVTFLQKAEMIKQHNQFGLFYYEDLIEKQKTIVSEMYDFFGVTIENIDLTNIKGSNGKAFVPQSSTNKNTIKKDGYHVGEKFTGLYKKGINRHMQSSMDDAIKDMFANTLIDSPLVGKYFDGVTK